MERPKDVDIHSSGNTSTSGKVKISLFWWVVLSFSLFSLGSVNILRREYHDCLNLLFKRYSSNTTLRESLVDGE